MKKLKKILLLSSIAIILIALSIFAFIKTLSSKVERIDIDRASITEVSKGTVPENSNEVITMALLGADYSNNNGAADVTMLLSINKKTNEINLCSLMRDMYLDLPDGGMSNLNYTLNDGGAELLLKTINYNFGLAIDKFAQVNLHTLPIIIDKLGGLELNIDNDELNYINNYIDNIDSENNTSTEHITTTGTQLLNGTQVAAYCRIRYTSGGDYKRTERHRIVINALFNKFKDISLTEGLSLSNEILGLVSTNLTDSEIISIGSTLLSMNSASINQGRFPEDGDHYTEWTDMYHMIIDKETTREKLQSFLYE